MSTIHMVPQVLDQLRKTQGKSAPGSRYDAPERPLASNPELVHAWSIGVEANARNFATSAPPERGQENRETCPPEVYIG